MTHDVTHLRTVAREAIAAFRRLGDQWTARAVFDPVYSVAAHEAFLAADAIERMLNADAPSFVASTEVER